ncbi:E3 ubiquitin-protein ligase [Hibiscus syriacus]|uniref:RING-type E3 ubiquitin transferase n=1 Tax=Hibiscus syriacus TaxID=106335 RepID=A0A6A2XFN2_HIBSY|nr:E3 ubiquitin-protein ligase [Hibiscus syriacus]
MESIGNPTTWVPLPYMKTKDCSQGLCSLYCPQWCYIIFPPPPPIEFTADSDSGRNFSSLVVAIIGILAAAFLLVSYYTIVSKYCGNADSTSRRESNHETDDIMEDDHDPYAHEPWQISTTGLDEALIKSITAFRYKKGDGFIQETDCSVCLNEFQDDESLRLLPKCSHAFHLPCIDTWLKSHSNCPLCRANIVFITASESPPVTETLPGNEQPSANENLADEQDSQRDGGFPKTPSSRAFSDLGNVRGRDAVIRIREEGYQQQMRRSISMDHFCQTQASVADQEIKELNPVRIAIE